jgi:hypothetical protein
MVFPVVGGNESKGYEISNSLRFNDADNPHLTRTPSSSGNRRTWTMSCWFKKCETGLNHTLFSTTGTQDIRFTSDERILVYGESKSILNTNRKFRDPSAWYHVVVATDTTQSTSSNRVKLYVNGTQESSFETNSQPSQNYDWNFNHTVEQGIGERVTTAGLNPHGYLADFHWIDGQQLDPTYFGETNDNGVWIPKKYTGTYGTNGFFMEFQQTGTSANSSGIGADTSGNDNHLTPANLAATDITEDTPTNNFATMNPLAIGADATLSEGNCQIAYGSGTRSVSTANMGFASGKWYWEWKISAASTDGCSAMPGIGGLPFGPDLGTYLGNNSNGYAYNGEDGKKYSGGANSAYGDTFTTNDIISVAFDADNGNLYFYKNGTIQNSGTAAYTSLTSPSSGFYYPAMGDASGAKTFTAQANFGNPPYSISSGNSDGKYGNFEYAPPSGYYAICTKRLAEFG